jgi:hypothetical protein
MGQRRSRCYSATIRWLLHVSMATTTKSDSQHDGIKLGAKCTNGNKTELNEMRARAKCTKRTRPESGEQVQRTSERFGAQWPTDTIVDDYGPVRSGRVSVSTVRLGCLRPSRSFLSFLFASRLSFTLSLFSALYLKHKRRPVTKQ